MTIQELREKMKAALAASKAICDAAEEGQRDFTADERTALQGHLEEAKKYKAQIKQAEGDAEVKQAILDLGAGIELAPPGTHQDGQPAGKGRTLGEQFVQSAAYAAWLKHVAPGGRIPESAKGLVSPPVEFRSLFGQKTLLTGSSDTSAGAFVQTDYTGIYEPLGRRPLTIRQLVSPGTTSSDLVEFVRQTTAVSQAAPVPEANVTDYSGATGEVSGQKPEGSMAFEKVTTPVRTIAVWIPATKRALSDAGQLRSLIDQELEADLEEDLEDEIINQDGTGEHFLGILNTPNTLNQAWDTDVLTTTRKAKTAIRVLGRARPTAWALNPADWEMIELLKDKNDRFYWGGPLQTGTPSLWGVPVIESEAVPEGTGILADWRKAKIWDREKATIQISDSHQDFFIRNMVAVLAEMRAAFGVIRPSAFVIVDLTSGS